MLTKKAITFPGSDASELMPREQLLGILFLPSYDRWQECHIKKPYIGACRFCGQAQTVLAHSVEEANEKATLSCNCEEAQRQKENIADGTRRDRCLFEAKMKIERLFGIGAEMQSKEPVSERSLEILNFTATLVYDRVIVKQTCNLTETIRAVIARTKNGNISIERKDTESEKVEII